MIVNFDIPSIGGFKLGDRLGIDKLNRAWIEEHYSKGWYISVVNYELNSFFINFKEGRNGFSSFQGTFIKDDKEIYIGNNITPDEIEIIFGNVSESFEDEISYCMRFVCSGVETEFDWNTQATQKRLNYISVGMA